MRLDEDVIAFFKQDGRGYQSKINAVLKAYAHGTKDTIITSGDFMDALSKMSYSSTIT